MRLIALRLFFGYLLGEPDIPVTVNPADRVALPTPEEHVVPVIADADLSALLSVCEGSSLVDLRDTALLRVLLDTGCRRAELAGTDVDEVDLRSQDLRLRRTKGGHERMVPVGSRTAVALRKYPRARARRPAAGICSSRSGPTTPGRGGSAGTLALHDGARLGASRPRSGPGLAASRIPPGAPTDYRGSASDRRGCGCVRSA